MLQIIPGFSLEIIALELIDARGQIQNLQLGVQLSHYKFGIKFCGLVHVHTLTNQNAPYATKQLIWERSVSSVQFRNDSWLK